MHALVTSALGVVVCIDTEGSRGLAGQPVKPKQNKQTKNSELQVQRETLSQGNRDRRAAEQGTSSSDFHGKCTGTPNSIHTHAHI